MKELWDRYDKKQINELPVACFEGRIIVVQSESESNKAVDYLLRQPLLGFDTETRPSFRPGPMHPVALLQVSSADTCFLFRLNLMGITDSLVRLLGDKHVTKVALSWRDDVAQLQRRRKFQLGEFFDLQTHVGEFGIEDMSLQKLFANVFGQKISKGQQLTNWEADVLTERQKLYAATDAWACLRLYEELSQLKQTGEWKLLKHEEPISTEE